MTDHDRNSDRSEVQRGLKAQLDSLNRKPIGDLSDAEVGSLQLRLEVLDLWARLQDSATGDMYHDHDTNQHHDHEIFDFGATAEAKESAE